MVCVRESERDRERERKRERARKREGEREREREREQVSVAALLDNFIGASGAMELEKKARESLGIPQQI